MQYDENTDTYTCHYGRKLVNVGVRKSKTSSGYISEKTMYQCEGCGGCPHKAQCIKHNARCNTPLEERTKRFELSKVFKKQREEMLTAPVEKLICRLALPTILGMLVTAVYSITDTFFL